MLYLFLDESGDLGFKKIGRGSSYYFVVTIMATRSIQAKKIIKTAIRRTSKNKLRTKKSLAELKGFNTTLTVKKYVYEQLRALPFTIYAAILDKRQLPKRRQIDSELLYRQLAQILLTRISDQRHDAKIEMIVDRSKSKRNLTVFNQFLLGSIQNLLTIYHNDSQATPELQLVDLFAWGIFRKYEKNDHTWYQVFKDQIVIESLISTIKCP